MTLAAPFGEHANKSTSFFADLAISPSKTEGWSTVHQNPMQINENQWKSKKINENPWKFLKNTKFRKELVRNAIGAAFSRADLDSIAHTERFPLIICGETMISHANLWFLWDFGPDPITLFQPGPRSSLCPPLILVAQNRRICFKMRLSQLKRCHWEFSFNFSRVRQWHLPHRFVKTRTKSHNSSPI